MKKILAETTGNFQLCDFSHGHEMLPSHRPGVVTSTNFFQQRVVKGQVTIHGDLRDDATDADFQDCLKESGGDRQLAIDAFIAEFGANSAEIEGKPRSKPRGGAKA